LKVSEKAAEAAFHFWLMNGQTRVDQTSVCAIYTRWTTKQKKTHRTVATIGSGPTRWKKHGMKKQRKRIDRLSITLIEEM